MRPYLQALTPTSVCWAIADVTSSSLSLFVYNEHSMPLDTLVLKK